MSQPKKQKQIITNAKLFYRLRRLPIVQQLTVVEFAAFIGLLLVNKGKPIELPRGIRMIKAFNLDKKIKKDVPTKNYLETLIYLTIYKRELFNNFIEHPEYPIWEDEVAGPIFDLMQTISEIYKV